MQFSFRIIYITKEGYRKMMILVYSSVFNNVIVSLDYESMVTDDTLSCCVSREWVQESLER